VFDSFFLSFVTVSDVIWWQLSRAGSLKTLVAQLARPRSTPSAIIYSCYSPTCTKVLRLSDQLPDLGNRRRTVPFQNVNKTGIVVCRIETRSCSHFCSGKAMTVTYSECVCSPSYPACNAHAPYCHLWPVRLNNIFPHYFINGTIFKKKKKKNKMCVLIFCTTFIRNISHSKKNWARYDQKCILVVM
jgi:hypothetical protein